jgi:hypothetical protein
MTPLALLPIPQCPNLWIRADLFGPMITADSYKKFVLCITNAFTKYSVVTAIANKDAEAVADAICRKWFSKFGIPAQFCMDGGKEFVNKLSTELFQMLNVNFPAYPQCNAQVEVYNKTVKKFKSFCNLLSMTQPSTGKHFYQHWQSATIPVTILQ